jgi:hypothetical protein
MLEESDRKKKKKKKKRERARVKLKRIYISGKIEKKIRFISN